MILDTLSALHSLRRQHHALLPPYLLHLPPPSQLALPSSQTYLIHHILLDPTIANVRPERTCQRGFWRRVVDSLESGVRELQDEVGCALVLLLPSSSICGDMTGC